MYSDYCDCLPERTRDLLHLLSNNALFILNCVPVFFCFFKKAYSSTNPLVKCSAMLASSRSQSHVAENLRTIFSSCNVNPDMFYIDPHCKGIDFTSAPQLDEEDTAVVETIVELMQCRDGSAETVFNDTEIIQLLHFLCVN